jgi:hypothetical protein
VTQSVFSANDLLVFSNTIANVGNVYVANLGITNVGNVVGTGYSMSVTDGIIFKKGAFIYVTGQSTIVDAYDNSPDGLSVGFDAVESIITADGDPSLFDNALGSPNFTAPGADRLQMVPTLLTRPTITANTSDFYSLVDFKMGQPVTINQDTQFNSIAIEEARRTYETNGDYVVTPFIISSKPLANTSDPAYANNYNAIVSKGLAYVNGYRVEYLNNNSVQGRRGTDVANTLQQHVSLNYGYYVLAQELSGEFGDFSSIISVDLHNVAKTSQTSKTWLGTTYSSTTKIGTAYIRGFQADNGIQGSSTGQYRLYLFDITMNPGYTFSAVKSMIYQVSGTVKGVADLVLVYNASSGANVATIYGASLDQMLFPFGQNAIKSNGFGNTQFNYRRLANMQFLTSGQANLTNSWTAVGTGSETFYYTGNLSATQINDFIVVPTANGYSTKSGTAAVWSTNTAVTGTGTSFFTDYVIGDTIYINGGYNTVVSITNNVIMNVDSPATSNASGLTVQKAFIAGDPIPFANYGNRSISISGNTVTFNLVDVPTSAFNAQVSLTVNRASTVAAKKVFNNNVFIKIDCSSHPNGISGPWSLGIPDLFNVIGIYGDNSGNKTYSNTNPNFTSYFTVDNGQRDAYYGLSVLSANGNSLAGKVNTNTTLLVECQAFTMDTSQGVGFFTANSYPVDDVNLANTNAIQTYMIPTYTGSDGTFYDLRNLVDFRPYGANTAAYSNTIVGATTNPSSTLAFTGAPYLPAPDTLFITDLQYYLGRTDRLSLDTSGNLILTEGLPAAANPGAPQEKVGTMTLGLLSVPPYPSLTTSEAAAVGRYDIAITSSSSQNRRYTMKDIGGFDKRITNLEYYTSLSLLEQSAASLQIRSSQTGQTRFQNGIFVDPFRGFDLSNTKHPMFYIGIDSNRSELRPAVFQMRSEFQFDTVNSTGVQQHGDLVMLAHTSENLYIQQGFASKYRNCIDGNIYTWRGTITLTPSGSTAPDATVNPPVVNNLDLASNFINLQNAWGTQWGNWETLSTDYTNTLLSASSSDSQQVGSAPATLTNSSTTVATGQVTSTTPVTGYTG